MRVESLKRSLALMSTNARAAWPTGWPSRAHISHVQGVRIRRKRNGALQTKYENGMHKSGVVVSPCLGDEQGESSLAYRVA